MTVNVIKHLPNQIVSAIVFEHLFLKKILECFTAGINLDDEESTLS